MIINDIEILNYTHSEISRLKKKTADSNFCLRGKEKKGQINQMRRDLMLHIHETVELKFSSTITEHWPCCCHLLFYSSFHSSLRLFLVKVGKKLCRYCRMLLSLLIQKYPWHTNENFKSKLIIILYLTFG
ncbi:hypothetical protein T05_8189 [Trichinella murrelli]|uniref:Uncharacterized protein n=1 Tax=Trichinella murrelli TaxID=144512 RepID=A0A0V0TY68_9BILA|nr:hypothetical protein T05_8189 [Trichinella murrelli]